MLLPDCDEEGEAAFRELLWQLSEANVNVRLEMNGSFSGTLGRIPFAKLRPHFVFI